MSLWPWNLPFPALKDIMLPMEFIPSLLHAEAPAFPALRRLHVFSGAPWITRTLDVTIALAPRLEVLRFSGPQADRGFPAGLASIIGLVMHPAHDGRPAPIKPRLENLRDVIVEAKQSVNSGQWRTSALKHDNMVMGLSQLDGMTRDGGPRVMFTPQERDYSRAHLVADWMDVVGSGNGCWTVVMENGVKVLAQLHLVGGHPSPGPRPGDDGPPQEDLAAFA